MNMEEGINLEHRAKRVHIQEFQYGTLLKFLVNYVVAT